jgi:membrane protein YdbS with pleckstrin-like domain
MAAPLPDNPAFPAVPSSLSVPDTSAPDREKGQGQPDRAPETEETDIWWGSYAGRAMLPGFLLCLFLTIILLALDWYLGSRQRRSDLMSSAVLALAAALWLFQGTRWVYRMIAVNYRLTNRRLLYTRGFKLPDSWAIELAGITEVTVVSGPLERLLGVGRIRIQVQDRSSAPLVLDGILAPQRVARTIRRRARQARADRRQEDATSQAQGGQS